jgi:hypothetical protein
MFTIFASKQQTFNTINPCMKTTIAVKGENARTPRRWAIGNIKWRSDTIGRSSASSHGQGQLRATVEERRRRERRRRQGTAERSKSIMVDLSRNLPCAHGFAVGRPPSVPTRKLTQHGPEGRPSVRAGHKSSITGLSFLPVPVVGRRS